MGDDKSDHDVLIELQNDMKWMREKVHSIQTHIWALTIPLILILIRFFILQNG